MSLWRLLKESRKPRTRTTLQPTPCGKQNLPLSSTQPVRAVSHRNRKQHNPHQVRTVWAFPHLLLPESHRDHVLPGRAVAWPRGAAARGAAPVSVPTAGVLRSEGMDGLKCLVCKLPPKRPLQASLPPWGEEGMGAPETPKWGLWPGGGMAPTRCLRAAPEPPPQPAEGSPEPSYLIVNVTICKHGVEVLHTLTRAPVIIIL